MIYSIKPHFINIGPCHLGTGIFAKRDIIPGQTLGYLTGQLVSFDQALELNSEGADCVQVGPGHYINPSHPFRYLNHSCSPNAGIRTDLELVSLAKIKTGEHVTFDYSTCMLERMFELECRCGSSNCRGLIQDFDLLKKPIQNRYLSLGIVQDFIVGYLQEAGKRGLKLACREQFLIPEEDMPQPAWLEDVLFGHISIQPVNRVLPFTVPTDHLEKPSKFRRSRVNAISA